MRFAFIRIALLRLEIYLILIFIQEASHIASFVFCGYFDDCSIFLYTYLTYSCYFMQILDRFSSHLKDVLAHSIRLATELKHAHVEPLHLLFCLYSQKGSVGGELINRFPIASKTIEHYLHNTLPSATPLATSINLDGKLLSPLSSAAKIALEKALLIAQEHAHSYIGTEHLLFGLLYIKDPAIGKILHTHKIKITDIEKEVDTVLHNATQFPHLNEVGEAVEHLDEQLDEHTLNSGLEQASPLMEHKKNKKKQSALEYFALELTSEDAQASIDPVIGRDKEIDRLIHILCRRTKNNPILLGDPGVGKTAIVEGLAKRIYQGSVPEILLNKKIFALDMGMLIAGTIYRGEFEGRLHQIIEEIGHNPDYILFIDELHNIVGAGSNQGTMDAANILKPALARGTIHCIGATTPQEFKKYIENDAALERRFQPIYVHEPSTLDTIKIIQGVRPHFETYHQVGISDDAIDTAVELSGRYIHNKFFPDKALDLIDETLAAKRLTLKNSARFTTLIRLKKTLETTIRAKEVAASQDKFSEAVRLKDKEDVLRKEIKKLEKIKPTKKPKLLASISKIDVLQQLAHMTNTTPAELLSHEPGALLTLHEKIKQHIVGQDDVVDQVTRLIAQAKLGLSHPDRPLVSCLFVGKSGVGKTELAKTIARTIYPGTDALIKLDMSEFNESFGVSKLLGSPAGYVGYKEQNHFTDKLKMNPHAVVLFDEIDKAHKDVLKLLLQILEQGELTDATGRNISLKHAIILLTTTYASEEAAKKSFGFGEGEKNEAYSTLLEKLKEFFSAEIINRLDQVCVFNSLSNDHFLRIAELELQQLNERLKKYHTEITFSHQTIEILLKTMKQSVFGARDIRRFIRTDIERLISEKILGKNIQPRYRLDTHQDKLVITS